MMSIRGYGIVAARLQCAVMLKLLPMSAWRLKPRLQRREAREIIHWSMAGKSSWLGRA